MASVTNVSITPICVAVVNLPISHTDSGEAVLRVLMADEQLNQTVLRARLALLALGLLLLGLSVGQSIDWSTPGGQALRVRVASISYQPEAAGDLTR